MQTTKKEFDLIVFGATGFTGGVATEYFAHHVPKKFRWAIAGRNQVKLSEIADRLSTFASPPAAQFPVDHNNANMVRELVAGTRVAISYAGPYGRYGESVLQACAELGTHYLDITGETLWVRRMIDRHEKAAIESGAILIPFAGFDSIPSDLGSWRVCALARSRSGSTKPITRVVNLLTVRGGFNGGTFETMLDILGFSHEENLQYHDPRLLIDNTLRNRFPYPELKRPVRIPEIGIMAPPFFMEPINSRVVYRSQMLRLSEGEAPFEYQELGRLPGSTKGIKAWAVVTGTQLFNRVARHPRARRLLKKYGLKSGQGPSQNSQANGFFRAQLFAYSGDELLTRFEMSYPGDPGNRATAVLSGEAALCLVAESDRIPVKKGGFWTPSTALGEVLYERLAAAGVSFSPENMVA